MSCWMICTSSAANDMDRKKGGKDRTSPGKADLIEVLLEEHAETIENLTRLQHATEYIRTNGFSFEAFMQIGKALRFIGIEIKHHNEKEEKFLFPLMDNYPGTNPQELRNEHRELRKLYTRLLEGVEDVEEGRLHANTVREILETSKALIEHLRSHIAKENEILFPMAKRLLSKSELEELEKSITREQL